MKDALVPETTYQKFQNRVSYDYLNLAVGEKVFKKRMYSYC